MFLQVGLVRLQEVGTSVAWCLFPAVSGTSHDGSFGTTLVSGERRQAKEASGTPESAHFADGKIYFGTGWSAMGAWLGHSARVWCTGQCAVMYLENLCSDATRRAAQATGVRSAQNLSL